MSSPRSCSRAAGTGCTWTWWTTSPTWRTPCGTFSCPSGYPVPVPKLILKIRYEGGRTASRSPQAGYTMHADFFNAWKPRR